MERFPAQFQPFLSPRRLIIGVLLVIVAGAGLWLFRTSSTLLNPAVVRDTALSLGPFGPLALIGVLAFLLVAPVAPAAVLQIGAGLAFGPVAGFLCTLTANLIGASAGFWLARRWGRLVLDPRLSPAMREQIDRLAQRVTWRTILLLRLLPGPAYPLVSFAAGYSRLGFGAYTLASLAGVAPALALLAFAGDLATHSPLLAFGLAAFVVGALAIVGRWLSRRIPPA
ncbi:MAG: VTT domain-containing protein [Roseiflexaceae bacterium]|nr:VTT domain-containing protein [Roseiflexaceae bacterium]